MRRLFLFIFINSFFLSVVTTGCGQTRHPEADLSIIGGRPTGKTKHRNVVAFMEDELTICSGTLIAPDLVLTAAHCFEKSVRDHTGTWSKMRVVFGAGSVKPHAEGASKITEVKIHPGFWDDHRGALDFAWVKIDPPLEGITPASLPFNRRQLDTAIAGAENATIVGFGLRSKKPTTSSSPLGLKLTGTVPIAYRGGVELFAGSKDVDTCSGDSGGPLFLKVPADSAYPDGLMLAGVTSRGPSPCASDFGYGIYGLTSEALCWLHGTSGWAKGNISVLDFCIRDAAIGATASTPLINGAQTAAELCASDSLTEAARHDRAVLMEVAGLTNQTSGTNCERLATFLGDARQLDLSHRGFRQLDWLRFAASLETLIARDNLITDASALLTLPNLRYVDLRNNAISDANVFAALPPGMIVLGSSSQKDTAGSSHFRELAEKGAALVSAKRATVIAIRDLLVAGNPVRRSKDLVLRRELNLDRRSVRSLEALRGLENLERLSVAGNPDIEGWEELLTLPALRTLRVSTDQTIPPDIEISLTGRGIEIIKVVP